MAGFSAASGRWNWGWRTRSAGSNDAIDLAKQMGNAPDGEVVMYKRPYGYSGSIYAEMPMPEPKSNDMNLKLPMSNWLPDGFYYLVAAVIDE